MFAWPLAGSLLLAASSVDRSADRAAWARLAAEALAGPISAIVERVVDGDTVDVRARIWLGQSVMVRVRIDGVDAPEMRSMCAEERLLAANARQYLVRRVLDKEVILQRVVYDKFGGRGRADVSDSQGSVAQALIAAGLARPYHGEQRRPWCATG